MLFIRDFGNIQHHRGDSFSKAFIIYAEDGLNYKEYTVTENDKIYWALMEPNQPWEYAILKKQIKDQKLILEPKDTMCLLPGKYYYQFKIKLASGEVYSLTPKASFYIME